MQSPRDIRYRFVRDDDGHNYLIPAEDTQEFKLWLKAGPYWDNYKGKEFNNNMINSEHHWTFIDPQEDI